MDHLQLRCPQCRVFRLPVLQLTVKLLHKFSRRKSSKLQSEARTERAPAY